MRVGLAVVALVNRVFVNVRANMAAGDLRINMGILLTNRNLPSVYSEQVGFFKKEARRGQYHYFQIVYTL